MESDLAARTDRLLSMDRFTTQTFAGPEEDLSRLVQQQTNVYAYDGYYHYQPYSNPNSNQTGINTRMKESTVTTYGTGEYPTSTRRTVHEDWTHENIPGVTIPRARKTSEYGDNGLYRVTYTDYDPTNVFHDRYNYVEVRDEAGQVVSRTDKEWDINRLTCARQRNSALEDDQANCSSELQPGDVRVATTYHATTGSPTGRVWSTKLATTEATVSSATAYEYDGGTLSRQFYSPDWNAVDRDVDAGTGLVVRSRDPQDTTDFVTEYDWDLLGRLKSIAPGSPEVPVDIYYDTIWQTRVRQVPSESSGNLGMTESTYIYDDLGRLIEEHQRSVSGGDLVRYTEYDISGRVLRQSEWTDDPQVTWTVYQYDSEFEDPDAPGTHFIDPLGRVSRVTRPDFTTIETAYEGLATHVTTNDIHGEGGLLSATTTYRNDEFGRLAFVESPGDGADASYGYDIRDNLVSVQLIDPMPPENEPSVQARSFSYDAVGRLHTATNPEQGTVEYEAYSERGKLLQYRDAEGNVFHNTYDDAGRPLTTDVDYPDGSSQPLSSLTYSNSRVASQTSYDADGTVVASTSYGYSSWGNSPNGCFYNVPGGPTGQNGLNGRLASVTTNVASWGENLRTDYCHYSDGRVRLVAYPSAGNERTLLEMKYENGFVTDVEDRNRPLDYVKDIIYSPQGAPLGFDRNSGVQDVITRDSQGRPKSFSVVDDSGETMWLIGDYSYDGAGNVKQIGDNDYYYDELNRLESALVYASDGPQSYGLQYAYDAFGNMVTRIETPLWIPELEVVQEFGVDRLTNRLSSVDRNGTVKDVAFDARGNMTMNGNFGYVFDGANRMTEVWGSFDPTNLLARYAYDGGGNRVRTVTEETETYFIRDEVGRVLSEFRRPTGATYAPVWNKDYIYALGQAMTLLKNSDPQTPGKPWTEYVTSSSMMIAWEKVEDLDVSGYTITRTVTTPNNGTVGPIELPPVSKATDSFVDTYDSAWGTDEETTIEYTVRASDTARNDSLESPTLLVKPFELDAPPTPQNLQAVALDGAVVLSWDPLVGPPEDFWGYYIEETYGDPYFPPGEPIPYQQGWVILNELPLEITSYYHYGLDNGESYFYRVYSVDTSGNMSAATADATAVPKDVTAPARPVNVKARPGIAGEQILVTWDPVSDPDLYVYLVNDGTATYAVDKNDTYYLDTGLSPAASYTYTVQARDNSANISVSSEPSTATTRDSSIPSPVAISAVFAVDDGGTPYNPSAACDVTAESDDVIGVEFTWQRLDPGDPDHYRVYRAKDQTNNYVPIAEVWATDPGVCDGGSPSVCRFFDSGLGYPEYTYHVVAVSGTTEGPADGVHTALDTFDPTVRNVRVIDGRFWEYQDDNKRIRQVAVDWSPLMETEVLGYHVYRRCEWQCWLTSSLLDEQLRDTSCTHSWQRLTDYPVADSFLIDTTVGELKGCFDYGVRAVGPDGEEGPIRTVNATFNLGGTSGYGGPQGDYMFCGESASAFEIFSKYPIAQDTDRVSNAVRGTESSVGPPDPPTIVDRNEDACICTVGYQPNPNGQIFYEGDDCALCANPNYLVDQNNARIDMEWVNDPNNPSEFILTGPYKGLYAYIDWLPNDESDLAGYHVEMAGSTEGPWVRLTTDPIAWWETHYDARVWTYDSPDSDDSPDTLWVGPECAVFQVIAVDQAGNESLPSAKFQVAPYPEHNYYDDPSGSDVLESPCSAPTPTLDAPEDLTVETESGDTKLTWNRVSDAEAYRVYRLIIRHNRAHRFYVTEVIPDEGVCPDEQTTCTVATETVDCDGIGNEQCYEPCSGTSCEFVEEGDPVGGSCPYSSAGCDLGYLDAFYVTAIEDAVTGVMARESPRSNIVLWDTTDLYAWSASPDELFDAVAQNEAPVDNGSWCEESVASLSCESDFLEQQIAQVTFGGARTAPLLTLGQGAPCVGCDIFDLHVDHLGSTRVVTDGAGTIKSQHDLMPFGEEITPIQSYNTKLFAGHERDKETGLDYMLARYYGANLGRFLSTDPVVKRRKNSYFPQRWNRYAYSLNNPIKYFDPDGRDIRNSATDPTTKAYANFLSSSPTVQALYGEGSGRHLFIRNTVSGEVLKQDGKPTTGRTDFASVVDEKTNKATEVKGAEIIIDAAGREPAAIQSDTQAEFGHAVLGAENPERHASPDTPDLHDEAVERGEEISEEAAQQGDSVTVTEPAEPEEKEQKTLDPK